MRRAVALALLLASVAAAAGLDARGWSEGTPASAAGHVLGDPPERIPVAFPKAFARRIDGPTLVIYFSPTCPHCRAVAPEWVRLAGRIAGKAKLIGVSSGYSDPSDRAAFVDEFKIPFDVIDDTDGAIAQAMGATSTPSVLLVRKDQGDVIAVDVFYPYSPGTEDVVALRFADNPWAAFTPGTYQGDRLCFSCHVDEANSWMLTHHSIAWRTLVKAGRQQDGECTPCHVTGAGRPGGWNGEATSALVDVGCEACHGPGGPHDGTRTEPSEACAGCHDEDHSIAFSYEKGLPLLDHYRARSMSQDAFYAAREALTDGEVPRALLAFREGTAAGAGACQSCHADEHAWWTADPHAHAMERLSATDAADPACVRCHATARRSGPVSGVEEHRTDEGVGCEACHGPGDAHIAAAGAPGTIEGLGDDCPVCVIEAVCTRCHTPRWDPTWNLDDRLGKVHHGPPAP